MNILNRKLMRDLWQARGQFLSALVIVIIGVAFYSGINATFKDLSGASKKYYQEYSFGDLWASFNRAPENIVDKLNTLPYVKKATGRVIQDVKVGISGENADIRLITLPDMKEKIVNDVLIKSGSYFSDADNNQCLVDEGFFKANNLKIGDNIYPVINGNEVKLKVIGSVQSPEYVYTIKDGGELVPDNKKFGIVYVKQSYGQAILGFKGSINNISLLLSQGTDADKANDDVKKLLKEYSVTEVIKRDDQISNRMLDEELKKLQSMGGSFPVIFFIVAAVIIYITMGRMVENQRSQIGVLKAFGFSNAQVLTHYLSFSVLIAVLGSIIGSIFGVLLGKGFTGMMNMYFNLPPADVKMYPELVIPASLLTLFFCMLAGYNSCKKVFRIMPSEAMRAKTPLKGRKILIERVRILWSNLGYNWKMVLRNIFRYKRRALLTSIGIIFSTALIVLAMGEKDSVDYLIDQQYNNIQNYDIKVDFSRFLNIEELNYIKSITHVAKLEPVFETGVEVSNGWRKKDVGITALIGDPQIYRVTDEAGKPVELPTSGLLIPDKLAETLNIGMNDKITVEPMLPGRDKKEMQVKGIVTQFIGSNVYINMNMVNSLLGEGRIANSAVIKLDSSTNEKYVIDKLNEMSAVSSVQSKSDSMNNLVKNMSALTSSIGVMILLAAVLSVAVIYNIATINIFDRQRELATLKVLGFKNNEIRNLIFNENYLITAFGILVGLPLGKLFGVYMMSAMQMDDYSFRFITGGRTFILAAVLTVVFTVLANYTLMRKISAIDMVEVLKSNE